MDTKKADPQEGSRRLRLIGVRVGDPVDLGVSFHNPVCTGSKLVIGIDPGTETGFAIWDTSARRFVDIRTLMVHRAWDIIRKLRDYIGLVVVEDMRHYRRRSTHDSEARLKGVGSVARDCSFWEDFLSDENIAHVMRKMGSRDMRKLSAPTFKSITGWDRATSYHGRDAAMMVYDWKLASR